MKNNKIIIKKHSKYFLYFFLLVGMNACKKAIEIPEPVNSITVGEAFSTDATANSAVAGIYNGMIKISRYSSVNTTVYTGLSSDELSAFGGTPPFQLNVLLSNDAIVSGLWSSLYSDIYQANEAIEGLQASTGITDATKKQLMGEAKFIRAFCHFYLINFFGDVPLVTTTAWQTTSIQARTPIGDVYKQIIADLADAQGLLASDYSFSGGERIRVNKWAANALMARVYLYMGEYANAESQATSVINNTALYNLVGNLNNVFLKNSPEAIWQLQPVYTANLTNYVGPEGNIFIPTSATASPKYYLTSQLLTAFETGDQRKNSWLSTTKFSNTTYYYPFKYKVRVGTANAVPAEYYMMLRLAEQYLIRAEARALQNTNISGAIADLNVIRARAGGIPPLASNLTQAQVIAAVAQERRIELFAEWGNRWFDLKRTGQADAVLAPIKPQWLSTAKLYPIPLTEMMRDPLLTQNPGYQ